MKVQRQANFLQAPHPTLYPAVWGPEEQIRPEARTAFTGAFLGLVSPVFPDVRRWVRFSIIGSGASYNWDEAGDIDVQVWISDSTKVADVRHLITANLIDTTCADLGLTAPDCAGAMSVQWYAKPGRGTPADNLAAQPYACYDLDARRWLVHPFPLTPQFYGDLFTLVQPRAAEVAEEAGRLLSDYDRAAKDQQFWTDLATESTPGRYAERLTAAQTALDAATHAVAGLYAQVAAGRAEAYSVEGSGIRDERDALVKMLEVWGIFDRLKHITQGRPEVQGVVTP